MNEVFVNPHTRRAVLEKVGTFGFEKELLEFGVEECDIVYAVIVEYTDGDSFHTNEGNLETVHVYKSQEKASELLYLINTDYANTKKNNGTVTEVTYQGEMKDFKLNSYVWSGYFESLDNVHVVPMLIEKDDD